MIQSKQDYKFYLQQDRIANNIQTPKGILQKIKFWFINNFSNEEWKFIKTLRCLEYYTNCKKNNSILGSIEYLFVKHKFHKQSIKLGYSIPPNVFDYGLSLPHRGNIVVNSKCKIGKNCRIHVGTNIGASGGSGNVPNIGDNVYIGPGAKIFGLIDIADNITIGANAVVNKSFNIPNTIIAGIPAQIVKENNPNWIESYN